MEAHELIQKMNEQATTKLFFFDTETTGVEFWKNGIWQIAGCIDIDGKIQEEFDFRVQPNPAARIDPEALQVANGGRGISKETIMAYPPMLEVYRKMVAMLKKYVDQYDKRDKFHTVGYNNASFDNPFFRAWFKQNGDNYFGSYFWSVLLDAMVMAGDHLKHIRYQMKDFKQATVAKQLGIQVDDTKLHDAAYDTQILRQIYYKVSKPLPAPQTKLEV